MIITIIPTKEIADENIRKEKLERFPDGVDPVEVREWPWPRFIVIVIIIMTIAASLLLV